MDKILAVVLAVKSSQKYFIIFLSCNRSNACISYPLTISLSEMLVKSQSFIIRSEQKSGEGLNEGDISNRQKDQSIINEQNAQNPALVDEKKTGSNLNSSQFLR